jgi:hypothetical protein
MSDILTWINFISFNSGFGISDFSQQFTTSLPSPGNRGTNESRNGREPSARGKLQEGM